MDDDLKPPRLAHWLFERSLHEVHLDEVLGDLEETYADKRDRLGPRRAQRWYWGQLVRSSPLFVLGTIYWSTVMLRNYLKIALRVLNKQKGYTLLNLAGLVLGLAPFIVVVLYIQHEMSFDRFHEKADQIYRIITDFRQPAGNNEVHEGSAIRGSYLWAQMLKDELPEVLDATRLHWRSDPLFQYGSKQLVEPNHLFADANVFEVFTLPLVRGNLETALVAPYSIVLTETLARKYFGDEDPMGKTLTITSPGADTPDASGEYTVTGIMEALPDNSHLRVDCLLSLSTIDTASGWYAGQDPATHYVLPDHFFTYVVLPEGYAPERLQAKFPAILRKYLPAGVEAFLGMSYDAFEEAGYYLTFHLQPLRKIYLDKPYMAGTFSETDWNYPVFLKGNARQIYFLGLIGLVLLVIACINFINLTTARAAVRAREVGVRKVVGAHRGQLVGQFLGEAILLALGATLLALVLAVLALPSFRAFMGTEVALNWRENWPMGLGLLGLALAVGLLAGVYPAFFLSSFQPVAVLKGRLRAGSGKVGLRNSLVVVQFVISIGLVVATLVVTHQLAYMREKDLGFDKEHVVVVENAHNLVGVEERNGQISYDAQRVWESPNGNRYISFKAELLRNPKVMSVSGTGVFLGSSDYMGTWDSKFRAEGAAEEEIIVMDLSSAETDIVATMGLEQVAGGDLVQALTDETPRGLLLNESAARLLKERYGWQDPIGHRLTILDYYAQYGGGVPHPIIGVVKDFNVKSLHTAIRPQVLLIERGWSYWTTKIYVRIGPGDVAGTLAYLEQTWSRFTGGLDFMAMQYAFLDQKIDHLYASEMRLQTIFGFFSTLAIVIACLGVFGLAAFLAERRTKEIGIRKVLGATVASLVLLLSKDFVRLVAVAFVVASPLAYLAMRRWLEGFAYRIELGVGVLLLVGVLALVLALLTVSYQSIRASLANPVESLRYE